MNTPAAPTTALDQAGARKTRYENRWTAAEDKILLAQILKGDSPLQPEAPAIRLTYPKLTAARFAGDPSPQRCQEGTTNPAGRGTFFYRS